MSFDTELMADTAERISRRCRADIDALIETHGGAFAVSVMGNVGVNLLAGVLASASTDDARSEILLAILKSLAGNTMAEITANETDDLINRVKKGI